MYQHGEGVVVDYQKAAGYGSADAMTNMALLYEQGLGVKKYTNKAEEWTRKAEETKQQLTK